jgi:hypothetical protein
MAASQDHTVRSMTTIMFRKRATPEFYAALAPETQVLPPSSFSRASEIGLLCMALQIRLQDFFADGFMCRKRDCDACSVYTGLQQ